MSSLTWTLFVFLCAAAAANDQRKTVVLPIRITTTLTKTTTTSTVCLITKNGPVPPCRKRRQLWFDDGPMFYIPTETFIQPTNIFQVEPTAFIPTMDWFKSDFYSGFNNGDAYVHPSMMIPVDDDYGRGNVAASDFFRKDPVQFRRQKTRTSKKTTVIYTKTKTITENEMTTKTHTLGISGCTPVPLPYDLCPP